jgi:hypothetical protein
MLNKNEANIFATRKRTVLGPFKLLKLIIILIVRKQRVLAELSGLQFNSTF